MVKKICFRPIHTNIVVCRCSTLFYMESIPHSHEDITGNVLNATIWTGKFKGEIALFLSTSMTLLESSMYRSFGFRDDHKYVSRSNNVHWTWNMNMEQRLELGESVFIPSVPRCCMYTSRETIWSICVNKRKVI